MSKQNDLWPVPKLTSIDRQRLLANLLTSEVPDQPLAVVQMGADSACDSFMQMFRPSHSFSIHLGCLGSSGPGGLRPPPPTPHEVGLSMSMLILAAYPAAALDVTIRTHPQNRHPQISMFDFADVTGQMPIYVPQTDFLTNNIQPPGVLILCYYCGM